MISDLSRISRIEERISRFIRSFDLLPLLKLLFFIGWKREQIRFRSHESRASQISLIHRIRFIRDDEPRVEITLNLGLLSPMIPVPPAMSRVLEQDGENGELLRDLLAYFDHRLISDFVSALYPEYFGDEARRWEEKKYCYLLLQDPGSPVSLHWLFSLVFPELEVRVSKTGLLHHARAVPVVMGTSRIGDRSMVGGHGLCSVQGLQVQLIADEASPTGKVPWPDVAAARIREKIFPLLEKKDIYLEIILIMTGLRSHATLKKDPCLGYDRLPGSNLARRVCLFNGRVCSTISKDVT